MADIVILPVLKKGIWRHRKSRPLLKVKKLYIPVFQSPICGRYCHFAHFEEGNMETQKIKAFAQGQSNFKISSKAGIELGSLIPESAPKVLHTVELTVVTVSRQLL